MSTTRRMSSGAMNWPFLTFTARPVARGGDDQVGLAAEEGGDLQHVADLGRRLALRRLVHVGEHRQPGRLPDRGEDPQPLGEAGPAEARDRAAVGLVERGLEDERAAEPLRRSRRASRAASSVRASLSITHGPAMTGSGVAVADRERRARGRSGARSPRIVRLRRPPAPGGSRRRPNPRAALGGVAALAAPRAPRG